MTKWTWKQGSEFGEKYGRTPSKQEQDELYTLAEIAWKRYQAKGR